LISKIKHKQVTQTSHTNELHKQVTQANKQVNYTSNLLQVTWSFCK